ncbi:hypothetical protein [Xanthomonas perforans]|uniref:hypothetical protein n=1 Tax=Xanthomonas perforans TaxID=442694 RepID=UPI00235906D5|nr:hypothetical protein [Xanthomonas perforans]MDC9654372.1 hypothetical protein [Xanthomonas perforans]MEB2158946.1 hypothetical protein [Xanthomonas campestris pv. campestris]
MAAASRPQFVASHTDLQLLARRSPYRGTAQTRANWLSLYYLSGAALDMRSKADALQDQYGITDRWFDTCFEMGDSDEVLVALMQHAESNAQLRGYIVLYEGQDQYDQWLAASKETDQLPLF